MSTDIRQEIEKILKELIAEYGDMSSSWWRDELFYKVNGKIYHDYMDKGCRLLIRDVCRLKNLIQKMTQLAIYNPEYALYVGSREDVILDRDIDMCVKRGSIYFDQVESLVPLALQPALNPDEMRILRDIFDVDPLMQVLDYAALKLGSSRPTHAYVCPQMHYVEYLNGDLGYLSMASAKRGIVAYCTTFDYYKYKIISGQWKLLNEKLMSIWLHISSKSEDYNKRLESLPEKQRKKYCDAYAIKDLISKEIEEADELMEQYGIIRVTFPLD